MNDFLAAAPPWDEMVDGSGGLRPSWHGLFATISDLGCDALAERAAQLGRILAEEGLTGLLPGAAPVSWRCDPVPLLLGAGEFAALEAGLAQRARLLDAVLADVYGRQILLSEG
ncbi:MAG TPA: circularly permuted type 2 ATP-grasp protein, partial [Acetobacteraceae bacterium]